MKYGSGEYTGLNRYIDKVCCGGSQVGEAGKLILKFYPSKLIPLTCSPY